MRVSACIDRTGPTPQDVVIRRRAGSSKIGRRGRPLVRVLALRFCVLVYVAGTAACATHGTGGHLGGVLYLPLLREKAGDFSVALSVMSMQPDVRRRRSATEIVFSVLERLLVMRLPVSNDSGMGSSAKKILRGAKYLERFRSSLLLGGLIWDRRAPTARMRYPMDGACERVFRGRC